MKNTIIITSPAHPEKKSPARAGMSVALCALLLGMSHVGAWAQDADSGMTSDLVAQLAKEYTVRYVEEWGAVPNDNEPDTEAIQAALDWAAKNNGYIIGLGKYFVDKPIKLRGSRFGFSFGIGADIFSSASTGICIHKDFPEVENATEETAIPVFLTDDVNWIRVDNLSINNRVVVDGERWHRKGLVGIKFSSKSKRQTGNSLFHYIGVAGLDWGMIIGDGRDAGENNTFTKLLTYECKHALLLNGRTTDSYYFGHVCATSYYKKEDRPNGFNNGPSDYAIKVDMVGNGAVFNSITLAHYKDMKPDRAQFVVAKGQVEVRKMNIESGYTDARAIDVLSGSTRNPIIFRNVYATTQRDGNGVQVRVLGSSSVIFDHCSFRGNIDVGPKARVQGSITFRGYMPVEKDIYHWGFVGEEGKRLNLANIDCFVQWDTDDDPHSQNEPASWWMSNVTAQHAEIQQSLQLGHFKMNAMSPAESTLPHDSDFVVTTVPLPAEGQTGFLTIECFFSSTKEVLAGYRKLIGIVKRGTGNDVEKTIQMIPSSVDLGETVEVTADLKVDGSSVQAMIRQKNRAGNDLQASFKVETSGFGKVAESNLAPLGKIGTNPRGKIGADGAPVE